MPYKKILTIEDISCLGQCSLTVALPIISAFGIECCILPSAVLSTHTTGFSNFSFLDLSNEFPKIKKHWISEKIKFDAIYTGYLGSTHHIKYVNEILEDCLFENNLKIVDPAFADDGKVYPGFDNNYIEAMKTLCMKADYIIPNLSEACFLTNTEYRLNYNKDYILNLLNKLSNICTKTIILTGVSYNPNSTGVVIYSNNTYNYYEHKFFHNKYHGTGDIFASTFVGSKMIGKSDFDATKIAADFTIDCINATGNDRNHWYGVKFEPVLYKITDIVKQN